MIEHINSHCRKHIITMEDPIEYVFEDNQSVIEQREVGLDTLSFQHGLKHVLRQDPDVIMVGEMRDGVSFAAAMSAADTGHLVLSTLHTTNSAQSVTRILDFFKADDREQVRRQLAGTLCAIITQRMVPTVEGRVTPAQEVLINTPTVRKLIEENRLDKLGAAIETGTEDGMQNFNQALFKLVKDGKSRKGCPRKSFKSSGARNELQRHLPGRGSTHPRIMTNGLHFTEAERESLGFSLGLATYISSGSKWSRIMSTVRSMAPDFLSPTPKARRPISVAAAGLASNSVKAASSWASSATCRAHLARRRTGDGFKVLHVRTEQDGLGQCTRFDRILSALGGQALADKNDRGMFVKVF
jgi:hypothetical protein